MAAAGGRAGGVHSGRFSRQLGTHLAAFLIALPLGAADIAFNPQITQLEFAKFSRVIGQGIFATPVQPARSTGLLGFDVGIAATAMKIDKAAPFWANSVPQNSGFVRGNYAAVPRIVASKGFSVATISASYAQFSNSGMKTYGGALDVPIIRGTLVTPEIALRGSYATMTGVDVLKLKTYGLEAFISKGFGPLMPYGAIGRMRTDSRGTISPTVSLHDTSNIMRYTAGLRLSLLIPKFVIEATQAEQRSYAAKISVGF
ncbi:MAG: hypothetical protein M3041_03860 [Acidobacteriota bacterium]|nr:hypothetical protein [Acidobacteriota bacterium]